MIQLYSGSGSHEVQVLCEVIPDSAWAIQKRSVVRLLEARGDAQASSILQNTPFELREGTNGFGDEFCILYYRSPLDPYIAIAEQFEQGESGLAYHRIAAAVTEAGHYIRFIVLDLDTDTDVDTVPIATPSLEISSDAVQRALADAEHLIQARGAASGVDRVHTAFHGYLRAVATKERLPYSKDSSITDLFALLRAKHPALAGREPRVSDIDRVLRSIAAIVDALNPVRNQATTAHPNELILREAEAMLVINSVMTLLHYLDARLREPSAT